MTWLVKIRRNLDRVWQGFLGCGRRPEFILSEYWICSIIKLAGCRMTASRSRKGWNGSYFGPGYSRAGRGKSEHSLFFWKRSRVAGNPRPSGDGREVRAETPETEKSRDSLLGE